MLITALYLPVLLLCALSRRPRNIMSLTLFVYVIDRRNLVQNIGKYAQGISVSC